MCLFLKKDSRRHFNFLFSFSKNNKLCKHRRGVIIESQTSFFQEAHVRFAIGYQFFLEIKHHVSVALLFMPLFQGLLGFRRHGFGHVIVEGRDGSHVRLVVGPVELMGEVPRFSVPSIQRFW